MSNSKIVRSLWHKNCSSCESILSEADFPAVGNSFSTVISVLFSLAEEALDTALLDYFKDTEGHYYSRLMKVDQVFADSLNEEADKARETVKLLQEQHLFQWQHATFKTSKPGVYPPTVEVLEQLVDSMKMVASKLGLSDCVQKIGSILYDPEGPESQDLFNGPAFIPLESRITNTHKQVSKLAAFFAHSPPDPKWETYFKTKYERRKRLWDEAVPLAALAQ